MSQSISLWGATYNNVPAIDLPKSPSGTATFTDVTDTTATASDVASGKYFYTAAGVRTEGAATAGGNVVITEETDVGGGTIVHINSDIVVSGSTTITTNGTHDVTNYVSAVVNVPTGSTPTIDSLTVTPTTSQQTFNSGSVDGYKPVVVNAMPSGTAGTPTATKGTVTNHSVSVTPSVTNTTGYITGSTKTGTAVTVSASELVSGSETKTTNGTYDVTNLASLVVAVPIVTYYTGSSAPSSSLGSNGDIYLQS